MLAKARLGKLDILAIGDRVYGRPAQAIDLTVKPPPMLILPPGTPDMEVD